MNEARRPAWTKTAAVTVLLGWLLLLLGYERLSESPSLFSGWSYDLLQLVLPARADTNTVIVYMDEESTRGANSKGREWDRAIHARFLNRLTKDQPRVVVFDVVLGKRMSLRRTRRWRKPSNATGMSCSPVGAIKFRV